MPSTRIEVESEAEEKGQVMAQMSTGIPNPSIYSRPRTNSALHHSHAPRPMVPHPVSSHSTRLQPSRQAQTYSQTHPHVQPNLQVHTNIHDAHFSHLPTIHVSPNAIPQPIPTKSKPEATSPIDSYPSPPPSDAASPPSSPELEGQEQRGLLHSGSDKVLNGDKGRRATITGHGAHVPHVPHGRKRVGSVARAGIAVAA